MFPRKITINLEHAKSLDPEKRKLGELFNLTYGENPHLKAAPYRVEGYKGGVLDWKYLGGSLPSFNKLREVAKLHELIQGFESIPTAITGKHGIISGWGSSKKGIEDAYRIAHQCDPEADLGNETILNRECTVEAAKLIGLDLENRWGHKEDTVFTEGICAPSYEDGAIEILKGKQKKKMTILQTSEYSNFPYDIRVVDGCFLVQEKENYKNPIPRKGKWVTREKGNEETEDRLFYFLEIARRTPSNAVDVGNVKVKDGELVELRTYGIGTSTKRSRAAKIALENAGKRAEGALLASDGFFPRKDNIELAGEYGISYIITPEGGIRKDEVIEEANKYGIGMYFVDSSIRLFSH